MKRVLFLAVLLVISNYLSAQKDITKFMGIPIALLGLSHPIGILIAGLFIAHITVGGFYMQIYDFTPEIIEMIISSIIYFSAFALLFKSIVGFISKKLIKKEEKNANE